MSPIETDELEQRLGAGLDRRARAGCGAAP